MRVKRNMFVFAHVFMTVVLIVACNENVSEKDSSFLPDTLANSCSIPFEYAYSFSDSIDNDSLRQKELARFRIIDAESGGNDVSSWAIKEKAMIIFYIVNDELFMANVSFKKKSQSWGKVHIFDSSMISESTSIVETLYFRWQFFNSYDSIRGIYRSEFSQKTTPLGTFCSLKISMPLKDSIVYKGYKVNSINTHKLFNYIKEK